MRITCPNCLAQYEIDGELLVPEGRDVQCSACDHVWFQPAPQRKPQRSLFDSEQHSPPPAPQPKPPELPQTPRPQARALDPAVTDILRDEARFEVEARRRDAGHMEMQPDLGLLGGGPWPVQPDPQSTEADQGGPAQPHSRANAGAQQAFPDIDDVSATLEPIEKRRSIDGERYDLPATARDRQRALLGGFVWPVAIGAVLVALYALAPLLSAAVPGLAPVLDGFAASVDRARLTFAALLGLAE
jgi:predicted Zn finger-like uncharacterized protein